MYTFTIIPSHAITAEDLSNAEFRVLALLARYADRDGQCYPSYSKLADEMSMTRRSMIRHMQELITKGYISRIHRKGNTRGNATNIFQIFNVQKFDNKGDCLLASLGDDIESHQGGDAECHDDEKPSVSADFAECPSASPSSDVQRHPELYQENYTNIISSSRDRYEQESAREIQNSETASCSSDEKYFFSGKTIKLTKKDFDLWKKAFHKIDLWAELVSLDAWWSKKGDTKNWFVSTSGMLNKTHQKALNLEKQNALQNQSQSTDHDDSLERDRQREEYFMGA